MPGFAGTDLRAIRSAFGYQLFGAEPSPRKRCGKGLGETECRRFAPPSVSEGVPYFLANPKNSNFEEKDE